MGNYKVTVLETVGCFIKKLFIVFVPPPLDQLAVGDPFGRKLFKENFKFEIRLLQRNQLTQFFSIWASF